MWGILALGAALLASFNPILYKRILKDVDPLIVVWAVTLLGLPLLGLFTLLLTPRFPRLDWTFFFAVGSTIFSWLLLRGRMIPVALAWLGVLASVLLVIILPLQLAGLFGGPMSWSASVTWLIWLPILVYEVVLALWLLIKGIAMPIANLTPSRADLVS